ncbi:MAG: replication-associated recombination protein A [Betaproteobacteria bacterium]|jgi:putative ATPase|nr:replication-associated recombination protein A [Betaproteobacteria bacterium]NCX68617.1 replication-associated recombination protein A [Betaproteobacteria bacterium]
MNSLSQPLAEILRPKTIDDVIGQDHLLGDDCPIRNAVTSNKLPSIILWGPPGVGKTSIAFAIANSVNYEFISLSAVLSGVKDIREAVDKANFNKDQNQKKTMLFIDEVHRFNKSQQDAFLPHVENGLFTFIGATTENPSFEVNSALLSRCQVYILNSLSNEALKKILNKALSIQENIKLDESSTEFIIEYANGDGRRLLNLVEVVYYYSKDKPIVVDIDLIKKIASSSYRRFDKGGEQFYDQISALHKSVRGSDPDASIYWLQRMLDGGADPLYLARRIIRIAIEDIGLADPRAQTIALEAYQIFERLGTPEGELALTNAVLYLAAAPKSNAAYQAHNLSKAYVSSHNNYDVPIHLRNAPTKLMQEIGYGKEYRYAHNEPHAYAAGEKYFPDELDPIQFYTPTNRGLEIKINEKLNFLNDLDKKNKNND